MSDDPRDDIDALISRYLDGGLDAAQAATLNDWVKASPANPRRLAAAAYLHRRVYDVLTSTAVGVSRKPVATKPIAGRIGERRARFAAAIAAAMLIASAAAAVYVFAFNPRPATRDSKPNPPIATVIDATGTLSAGDRITSAGEEFTAGDLALDAGVAEFRQNNGVGVTMHGATHLTVHNPMHATLTAGSATFDCPPAAHGYTVHLPGGARVVDLGTRFTVAVGDRASVWVAEGEVRIEPVTGATLPVVAGELIRLGEGDPVRIKLPRGAAPAAVYRFTPQGVEPLLGAPKLAAVGGVRFEPTDDGTAAALFDAPGQRLASEQPAITDTDDWMIEATVRPDTDRGTAIVVYNGRPSGDGFGIVRRGAQWAVLLGHRALRDAAPAEVGRSVRLGLTRRGGLTQMHVDGVAVGPAMRQTPGAPTSTLLIGGTPEHAEETFLGAIGDVRLMRLNAEQAPADAIVGPDLSETSRP